jgi:hypothetical protein
LAQSGKGCSPAFESFGFDGFASFDAAGAALCEAAGAALAGAGFCGTGIGADAGAGTFCAAWSCGTFAGAADGGGGGGKPGGGGGHAAPGGGGGIPRPGGRCCADTAPHIASRMISATLADTCDRRCGNGWLGGIHEM